MKKCALIANGYYRNEAMAAQLDGISGELNKLGVLCTVVYSDKIITRFEGGNIACEIGDYDFIIFLDKDPYTSYMLEKWGYKLVNTAKAIELCDDKLRTYIALSNNGIAIPDTVYSPLNYARKIDDFYLQVEEKIGYPVVVKEVFGSMGKSVYLAKNRKELAELREKLIAKAHLYQKFIGRGGEDIRVIVIGGKVVGAMRRVNDSDFRSNIELGGRGEKFELDKDKILLAEKSACILGLDYCGIDILSDGEKNYVCEVNSNAFFRGFEIATGINVAKVYAEYIYNKFYK